MYKDFTANPHQVLASVFCAGEAQCCRACGLSRGGGGQTAELIPADTSRSPCCPGLCLAEGV